MWSRDLFQDFCRIAFLVVFVCLCSCDNLFGPDLREIAGGYRLKRASNPDQFALTVPYESGGLIIDEIGWREPIIVARASGSEYWDVINTARAQHIRVSDQERKSDPVYQSIQIEPAQATLVVRRARSPRRRLLDPPIIDGRREFSRSARLRETYCRAALARLGSHSARGNRISRRLLRVS